MTQLKTIIDPLKALHDLTESKYLSADEISTIGPLQERLKAAVLGSGWMRLTPKIHLICCHLEEFAQKFRTLGMHTEQGLEFLHALYTEEEKNFQHFKEPSRSKATALRLNGLNMERLTNSLCLKLYDANRPVGKRRPVAL